MKKFQAVIHARRDEIAEKIMEDPADQPEVRWTVEPEEDGMFAVEFEARVINPDHGYESDWFWQDRIIITRRGRLVG